MIQRKQTLFLILFIFTSVANLFLPCNYLSDGQNSLGVSFLSTHSSQVIPNVWHYIGLIIDLLVLTLSFVTIFLFKKRHLQVKLCYALMLLQLGFTCIVSFAPTVLKPENRALENSGVATIIGVIGILAAYFAAFYIKKDIELLKSADRIR